MRPTVQKVAITWKDGSLGILAFVIKPGRAATSENIEAELAKFPDDPARLPALGWRLIEEADIPEDRTFRNAWTDTGASILCDIGKARLIWLNMLRARRADVLEKLDRDWMRATGQKKKEEADQIEAKRQALRDLPARIQSVLDAAKTPDELKKINPFDEEN